MKTLHSVATISVPEDVTVTIKSRRVTVSGKHGTLKRDFRHAPVDMKLTDNNTKIRVEMWLSLSKVRASLQTVCSHVSNLITGVRKKYQYKLRLVYAHFPINANIINNGKTVEIRNFLGEKVVRTVDMLDGVIIKKSDDVKDEIIVEGSDLELTSRSAALIHQSCLVKNKDIRKFLDGIYVSHSGVCEED